jgi:hypothetical protein
MRFFPQSLPQTRRYCKGLIEEWDKKDKLKSVHAMLSSSAR